MQHKISFYVQPLSTRGVWLSWKEAGEWGGHSGPQCRSGRELPVTAGLHASLGSRAARARGVAEGGRDGEGGERREREGLREIERRGPQSGDQAELPCKKQNGAATNLKQNNHHFQLRFQDFPGQLCKHIQVLSICFSRTFCKSFG